MMKRHMVSLLIAMVFLTMAITGIMGFFLPFNLLTVSVHSLMGFLFIAAIALHLNNNFKQLRSYFSKPSAIILLLFVIGLITIILLQPKPVRSIIGLSDNLGPELDQFEIDGQQMIYRYAPAPHYKMELRVMGGTAFDSKQPPAIAIWIENRSGYHIKSLHTGGTEDPSTSLPYWHFKRSEYLKYKKQHEEMSAAEREAELDAMSSATENDSFNPEDYIVPKDPEREAPYRVLIEINQHGDKNDYYDDQPSLVYSVEIDNRDPRTFQVLEVVGYPKSELDDDELKWSLYFVDETMTTSRDLLDSAMMSISRSNP